MNSKSLVAIFVTVAIFMGSFVIINSGPSVNTSDATAVKYIHDTIYVCDHISPTKVKLIEKDWLLDEVNRNISGQNERYLRGSVNNTGVDYDNIKIHFNEGGSGVYTDEKSINHTLTWKFTDENEQSALIVIDKGGDSYIWNMIAIDGNYLYQTSPYGRNILVATRYKQISQPECSSGIVSRASIK